MTDPMFRNLLRGVSVTEISETQGLPLLALVQAMVEAAQDELGATIDSPQDFGHLLLLMKRDDALADRMGLRCSALLVSRGFLVAAS